MAKDDLTFDVTSRNPCCEHGPLGHTEQQHHDASACFDSGCALDHPHGGPFPHPCDRPAPSPESTVARFDTVPQISPNSWLSKARFVQFKRAYEYACTCTKAIEPLSKLTAEETYWLWSILQRGIEIDKAGRQGSVGVVQQTSCEWVHDDSRREVACERAACDYCGRDFTDTETWCAQCDPGDSWKPTK